MPQAPARPHRPECPANRRPAPACPPVVRADMAGRRIEYGAILGATLGAAAVVVLAMGAPAHAQPAPTPSYRTPVTPAQPGLGPQGSGSPAAGSTGVITPPAGVDSGIDTTPRTPGTAAPMPVIPPPGTRANPSAPVPR